MKRRLFTLASALSLLACLASLVLWVQSHSVADRVQRTRWRMENGRLKQRYDSFLFANGRLVYTLTIDDTQPPNDPKEYRRLVAGVVRWDAVTDRSLKPSSLPRTRLGFYYDRAVYRNGQRNTTISTTVGIHGSLLLTLFAVLPLWLLARLRRNWFLPSGACQACGYDLRASTVRCPECGTPIPQKLTGVT